MQYMGSITDVLFPEISLINDDKSMRCFQTATMLQPKYPRITSSSKLYYSFQITPFKVIFCFF
jgi:hypothetical protein